MSDDKSKSASPAATQTPPAPANAAPPQGAALTDLMAAGDKATAKPADKPKPDLEANALRAAHAAVQAGAKALAEAQAHLQSETAPSPQAAQRARRRELALRALLVVNVVAMLIVSLLPSPTEPAQGGSAPLAKDAHGNPAEHGGAANDGLDGHGKPEGAQGHGPRYDEPYNRALATADRGDFAGAVTQLEAYLADNPRMQAGSKAAVLNALAYYASRAGDWQRAQQFTRQLDALKGAHSLPEDLVAEAKAALAANDQDKLRRTWARFLLQQKQIPTWLYPHVAEAYLQLGDSYRKEAEAGAAAQRLLDAKAAEEQLREAAIRAQERGK